MQQSVEWSWLGSGTFGRVLGVSVPTLGGHRRTDLALKIVPVAGPASDTIGAEDEDKDDGMILDQAEAEAEAEDEGEEEEEEEDYKREIVIGALVSLLDAPSFVRQYAVVLVHAPEHREAVARLVTLLDPHERPLATRGALLVIAQEKLRGTPVAQQLYRRAQPPSALGLALVFQLVWSLAVAEAKLGFEHNDLSVRNLFLDTSKGGGGGAEHYTLFLPHSAASFDLPAMPHRLVLLDFGKSGYWDATHDAPALPSHPGEEVFGSLLAPEDYFITRRYTHTFASEHYLVGLLAFSLLCGPHLDAVVTPAERELLGRHVKQFYSLFDLHDLLPRLADDVLPREQRPQRELVGQFREVLVSALPRVGAAVDSALYMYWKRRIEDREHVYGRVYAGYLGQALLRRALFGDGTAIVPPATNAMASAPYNDTTRVWYRLLQHASVRAYFERPEVLDLQRRAYGGLLARLSHDERVLLRQLLAWSPDDRPTLPAVLLHDAFRPLRATPATTTGGAMRFFSWHAAPPLSASAPQRKDGVHMAALRSKIHAVGDDVPELLQAPGVTFEGAVRDLAEALAREETGS